MLTRPARFLFVPASIALAGGLAAFAHNFHGEWWIFGLLVLSALVVALAQQSLP